MKRDEQRGQPGAFFPIRDNASAAVMSKRARSKPGTAAAAAAFRAMLADQLRRSGLDADVVLAATDLRGFSGRRDGPTEIGLELPNGIHRVILPMLAMDVVLAKPPGSLAIELAKLIAACWTQADATAAALIAVAEVVERFVAEPANAAMGLRLVGIEPSALSSTSPYEPTAVVICMSMLDRDLEQADMRFIARDAADAASLLDRELPSLNRRSKKRAWLDAHRADFVIDTFTLELLAYVGLTPKDAHALLADRDGAELTVPGRCRIAGADLTRLEGAISSRCELNDDAYWDGDCLLIRGKSIPATVLLGAQGRRIGDLVGHPLFSGDLRLASGRSNGEHSALFIERRYRYFRISDGAVWGDDEMRLPDVFGKDQK